MWDGVSLSDLDLQRADGFASVVLTGSEHGTRIVDVFERSPIRIMFPGTRDSPAQEAVLVNTAGGIAGGDRLECVVTVLANASVTVTSQAAERVYRALSEPARVVTTLRVCAAAKLAWLPQETIVFNGGRLRRKTEIDLTSGAELLALEWLVLGRGAHGEELTTGQITDVWRVKKDGRLIWADGFHATDAAFARLQRRALLAEFKCMATLVYFGPDLHERLQLMRDLAPALKCRCAATAVAGLLVTRCAAKASAELRAGLQEILQKFDHASGSGPFRIPKMWSC
jgi:urease accessory protein